MQRFFTHDENLSSYCGISFLVENVALGAECQPMEQDLGIH
jgi:hypothetical protein